MKEFFKKVMADKAYKISIICYVVSLVAFLIASYNLDSTKRDNYIESNTKIQEKIDHKKDNIKTWNDQIISNNEEIEKMESEEL